MKNSKYVGNNSSAKKNEQCFCHDVSPLFRSIYFSLSFAFLFFFFPEVEEVEGVALGLQTRTVQLSRICSYKNEHLYWLPGCQRVATPSLSIRTIKTSLVVKRRSMYFKTCDATVGRRTCRSSLFLMF